MQFYFRIMHPIDSDGMANSVESGQTAPEELKNNLIWGHTVCPDMFVQKLGLNTLACTENVAIQWKNILFVPAW